MSKIREIVGCKAASLIVHLDPQTVAKKVRLGEFRLYKKPSRRVFVFREDWLMEDIAP